MAQCVVALSPTPRRLSDVARLEIAEWLKMAVSANVTAVGMRCCLRPRIVVEAQWLFDLMHDLVLFPANVHE